MTSKNKTTKEIANANNVIRKLIKGALTKQNITLEKFAREVKINSGTLAHFMQAARNLSITSLVILVDYFNVSVDDIMGRMRGKDETN